VTVGCQAELAEAGLRIAFITLRYTQCDRKIVILSLATYCQAELDEAGLRLRSSPFDKLKVTVGLSG